MKKIGLLLIAFVCWACMISNAQSAIVIMDNNTSYGMQAYFSSGSSYELQENEIDKYWDKDYYITSVAHGSWGWFVSMSQGVKWTDQSYIYQASWPDNWIFQKRKEGKYITSLASSDNKWMIVASSNSDYTAQEICAAPWSTLKDFIKKWWDNDYYITSVACQKGLWTVVMSKTKIYKAQAYFWSTTTSDLSKKIDEKWDEGYSITTLEYGGGEYFCIMSKYNDSKSRLQHWHIGLSGYQDDIKKYWDKSWRITYIGG